MKLTQYLKNKLPLLLLNLLCMLALSLFLSAIGNSPDTLILILAVWLSVLLISVAASFFHRRRQLELLLTLTEQLKERYLIAELMKLPERADDQVYYQILKMAEKSMLEQIAAVRRERLEYKEYIEQWVHEMKTPLTAMKLLCENNRSPVARELMSELEKSSRFTDQVLYYARSEHTEKDYLIREIRLSDVVHLSVSDNRYLLQQHQVAIQVGESEATVYSDEKWLRFILGQLIANAVKYRTGQPVLRFSIECGEGSVRLLIGDNGIGIPAGDLPRIFEKGFTGQNGRTRQNSTGIGLYLCKRLCDRLDIGIDVRSGEAGTTICLSFSINYFIHHVQD